MTTADVLRGLLPPVAYDPNGDTLAAVINAEANAIDNAIGHAVRVSNAMHPGTAGEDIADWERFLALVSSPSMRHEQRVQAVLSKLGELGGLSIPYFERLAAASGYTVTVIEPLPWRVGHSGVDEPLYPDDILFVWLVRIDARPPQATEATDAALEATFINLKPAHTFCQFVES